jgi:hypothetical protein
MITVDAFLVEKRMTDDGSSKWGNRLIYLENVILKENGAGRGLLPLP